jgi:outer membrane protein
MQSNLCARCAASLLAIIAAAPLAAQGPQKFAYVDTRAILEVAPGRVEAEAQLQKEGAAMKATIDKMNENVVVMMSDYSKLPATTTQPERDKKAKAVQDKQAELQQKNQELQDQYNQRQAELLQPILDQIKLVLEDLRVEGGYTFIFDIGQNAAIVAADKNLNISDRAIARLRTMPKPTIAARSDSARKPVGAPLNGAAGVTRPGTTPPQAPTKKPDSTATKKPDSTATKKPAGE